MDTAIFVRSSVTETTPTDPTERVSPRLLELEAIVDSGVASFIEVGNALMAICEEEEDGRRLYMQRGYSNFGDYCRTRWGFGRDYAYKHIRAAQLAPKLYTNGIQPRLTERLVRPLVSLPEEVALRVWERSLALADEEKHRVTDKHVRIARWEIVPPGTNPKTGERPEFHPVIKPTDNWNFSPVLYERIDGENIKDEDGDEKGYGYIPGDLYVNCFWHYARPGDIVADLMAGSGMAWHVYQDRVRWLPEDEPLEFAALHLFDLNPRGPYQDRIVSHDATTPLPVDRINYAFVDPPYFSMANGQYGHDGPENLANQDFDTWAASVSRMVENLSHSQLPGDRATIVTPNYSDTTNPDDPYLMVDQFAVDVFRTFGYRLFHRVASSRRIQQTQGRGMAFLNANAKRRRVMLTDISHVLTFVRMEAES